MKNSCFVALFLAAAGLLAGCETTVDLPEPPHTPRVALFHVLTPAPEDSSFRELYYERQLYVSNSRHVFDASQRPGRSDATVELRNAAGSVVERYRALPQRVRGSLQGGGYYRPVFGFRPQPGQTYTLRATLPGLEPAESTLTMPAPAAVESATYTSRAKAPSNPNEYRGRLSLVLRDDPAVANYYLAYARVLDRQGQPGPWSPVNMDYNSQNSGGAVGQFQLSTPQESYNLYPFADTDVNGQRISLTTDVRFYNIACYQGICLQPGYIEVYVSSITADAYNFYLSRRRYFDSADNPFAEPAPLASNVRADYGLFGGATDVKYRIPL